MVDEQDATLTSDEALLKEIRERYTYAMEKWRPSREERQIDMRYVSGNPWDDADKKARKDAGRPCISHDELNQYVNQACNNLRQNKRGIKISPLGNGANDKTAELNQDKIRTIEYRSNAQSAYTTAYQCQLEGSYGFIRLSRRYAYHGSEVTEGNADHQELAVKNIANPDSVLYDPDCKDADWGDAQFCFVLDPITREEFKRQHPKAKIQNFSSEDMRVAGAWLSDRMVLRAEYWRAETSTEKKFGRTITTRRIVQYITNGVEILARNPEPEDAVIIPIIPVIGKEVYLDDGSGIERLIMSLIRLARDPQMSLAYLCSQEMEEAGLTPKVPYMGYVGQFETDSEAFEQITKVPRGMVQVDPVTDKSNGEVLPLPQRVQFTPNFQQYEVAKDACRRAVQAAMGTNSLPTAAQRNNEKSGVALEQIQKAQDIGSFHFLDNFDRALMLLGRAMLERFKATYGQENREMMLLTADEKHRPVRLNTPEPYLDESTGDMVQYTVGQGSHSVTISTGPSAQSEREVVDEFVDGLIANLKNLPIPQPILAKILSIAIQMKNLGPKGDQLAELISPQEQQQLPPEAQAAIGHAQQMIQAMQAELQKLQLEKAGHVIQGQFDVAIEKMKLENALAVAEISTKSQQLSERVQLLADMMSQFHDQAHDAAMQADAQGHQAGMAQQDAAAQQQQAAAEQQQQQQPDEQAA